MRTYGNSEFINSDAGQAVIEILRDDEKWEDLDQRTKARTLFPAVDEMRQRRAQLLRELEKCDSSQVESDLKLLDEQAAEIAEIRAKIAKLKDAEEAALLSLNQTKDRLSYADMLLRRLKPRLHARVNGDDILFEICRDELEAAGFEV